MNQIHKNALTNMHNEIKERGFCRLVSHDVAKDRCTEINEMFNVEYVVRGATIPKQ